MRERIGSNLVLDHIVLVKILRSSRMTYTGQLSCLGNLVVLESQRGKGIMMSFTVFDDADGRVKLILLFKGNVGWRNDVALDACNAPRTRPSETRLDGLVVVLDQ
mmetsp:Transcript_33521/g.70279  ORF Transcript_33521/g.70279 Transcript_33521/m.70279 type:complete len:105 (-) Transcript_33521:1352-1666(-)